MLRLRLWLGRRRKRKVLLLSLTFRPLSSRRRSGAVAFKARRFPFPIYNAE